MSNGFETCDKHTYLFATEAKDCPYCRIDELEQDRDGWIRNYELQEKVVEIAQQRVVELEQQLDRYQGGVEVEGRVGIDSISGDQCIRVASKTTEMRPIADGVSKSALIRR